MDRRRIEARFRLARVHRPAAGRAGQAPGRARQQQDDRARVRGLGHRLGPVPRRTRVPRLRRACRRWRSTGADPADRPEPAARLGHGHRCTVRAVAGRHRAGLRGRLRPRAKPQQPRRVHRRDRRRGGQQPHRRQPGQRRQPGLQPGRPLSQLQPAAHQGLLRRPHAPDAARAPQRRHPRAVPGLRPQHQRRAVGRQQPAPLRLDRRCRHRARLRAAAAGRTTRADRRGICRLAGPVEVRPSGRPAPDLYRAADARFHRHPPRQHHQAVDDQRRPAGRHRLRHLRVGHLHRCERRRNPDG